MVVPSGVLKPGLKVLSTSFWNRPLVFEYVGRETRGGKSLTVLDREASNDLDYEASHSECLLAMFLGTAGEQPPRRAKVLNLGPLCSVDKWLGYLVQIPMSLGGAKCHRATPTHVRPCSRYLPPQDLRAV